jgi:hypothetical protein
MSTTPAIVQIARETLSQPVVYDLHQANARVAADVEASPTFSANTMLQLLTERYGPRREDAIAAFSLHSGKDRRTVFRYLSGELPIPRWAALLTVLLHSSTAHQMDELWNKAREAATTYPPV